MAENMLLFLTILLGIAVWRVAWQKTLICETRDRLFDIRDTLRRKFIELNLSLEDKAYMAFRGRINSYLKNMEALTVGTFWAFLKVAQKNPQEYEKIKQSVARENEAMETEFAELNKEIKQLRSDAAYVLIRYMLLRNIITAVAIAAPVFCITHIADFFNNTLHLFKNNTRRVIRDQINPITMEGFTVLHPDEAAYDEAA